MAEKLGANILGLGAFTSVVGDAGLLVAPVFRQGAPVSIRKLDCKEGFRWLTDNALNYASLLQYGFATVTHFIEHSGLYALTYSKLDDAIDAINQLHEQHTG